MEITAQKRNETGKRAKVLRKEGLLPSSIFGHDISSTPITIGFNEFTKVFNKAGETSLIDLNIENKSYKVLVKEVQLDPISGKFIHIGFYRPNLSEKTEVEVPVEIVGEEKNELIKNGGGIVLMLINEIRVKALPTDLPDKFEVDITELNQIGANIKVGQLNYDRNKVEILDLDEDELVVKIEKAEMEEEVEEVPVSEEEAIAQVEATSEKAEEDEEDEKGAEEPKKEEKKEQGKDD